MKRTIKTAQWHPIAAVLQLLGIGTRYDAATLATLARVPTADVDTFYRLGLVQVHDGVISDWRR